KALVLPGSGDAAFDIRQTTGHFVWRDFPRARRASKRVHRRGDQRLQITLREDRSEGRTNLREEDQCYLSWSTSARAEGCGRTNTRSRERHTLCTNRIWKDCRCDEFDQR